MPSRKHTSNSILILLLITGLAQAQVVLTEIMFDPLGSESVNEFIEIVNLSNTNPVNLAGWQISDGVGTDGIIETNGGLILQPGQFAVILDPSYFGGDEIYAELIPEASLILTIDNSAFGSGGLLNSTPETVSLINSVDEVVSQYTYSVDNEMGFSDEKIILADPNTPDNWANSRIALGTPGAPNSVSPLNHDLAFQSDGLRFDPERVSAGDAVTISARVHNVGLRDASDFSVTFFDDLNGDLRPDADESIAPPLGYDGSLPPGDLAEFAITYMNLTGGFHTIIAQVDFAADQDTVNNFAAKELLVSFAAGTLVINEIMYSPLSAQAEWFEVVNPSSRDVPLEGWRFSDSDVGAVVEVDAKPILKPGDFLVFAQDSTILEAFEPPLGTVIIMKEWSALNDNSDSVVLFDLTGDVIDRVDYANDWGGDRGVSLEKINPELASNDSTNWSSSVALAGGTPGEQNSLFTDIVPTATTLNIEPNPFSPDGDGLDDFAAISFQLPLTSATSNIKIYDLRGRLIRFLANNRPSASQNLLLWDGRDDSGQVARMGIYIVFLQALNAQAGVITTEKKTVVLAGKL